LNFGERNLFEAQMAEFIRVVRSQKEPSRCTLKDSLLLLDVLEKIKKEN
jgi:predicted dehydrogenase